MVVRRDVARAAAERLIEAGERRLGAVTEELARTVIAEPVWRMVDPEGRSLRDIDTTGGLALDTRNPRWEGGGFVSWREDQN